MSGIGWNFPVLVGGGEEGYTSNDIEGFKGEELYNNLVRETCQNSLDAREQESGSPVVVRYELREYNIMSYDFFKQYIEHLEGCRRYWLQRSDKIPEKLLQMLERAQKALSGETVKALVVSDFNTPGLVGSKDITGSFNALVYADGVSFKESETSAGSFGIGRNAPFACSDLSCVCYSTKAIDGGMAFAGVAKLATALNKSNQPTRRQGRYQYNDDDNSEWRPVQPEDNDEFARCFDRTDFGTDVIILGFSASDDWQNQLKMAVLRNFFLAIHQQKLVVEIQGERLDSTSISLAFEKCQNNRDMMLAFQYYKAVVSPESAHGELSILGENDAQLFIRTGDEVEPFKSVAWFRSSGMLIRSYRPRGIFRPYVGVFIAEGELDKLLRATEPARHNDWDYERIERGSADRARARLAIADLKNEIKTYLKEVCETAVEDTIDAVGAANYLPDNIGGKSEEGGGTDMLRPLIRLGKSKVASLNRTKKSVSGIRGTGRATDDAVGNSRRNPNPENPSSLPSVEAGEGNEVGIEEGRGNKILYRAIDGRRRIFAIAPEQGIYRLVLVPEDSAKSAYISCHVMGENGTQDVIEVKAAMLNGKHLQVDEKGGTVGPFEAKKDERLELTITFKEKGSMALAVDLKTKEIS